MQKSSIMNRRDLLKSTVIVPACFLASSLTENDAGEEKEDKSKDKSTDRPDEKTLVLRPHHLLDILSGIGLGQEFKPDLNYGHALHLVAKAVRENVERKVRFVVAADDVCKPCKHLKSDGKCDDILPLSPPMPKQEYNDRLDRRLLEFFEIKEKNEMTLRRFFERVDKKTPGLEKVCTHPKEDEKERLKGLEEGLIILGIRRKAEAKS